jgi:hypothetical protein
MSAKLSRVSFIDSLQLQGNAFEGEALSSLYSVSSLQILRLDNNPISGTIESRIRNLVNLRELWLAETDVGGSLPDELFGLPQLDTLRLGGAKFEGTLSDDFRLLNETINIIDLHDNDFSGEIPVSAFGACDDLGRWDLVQDYTVWFISLFFLSTEVLLLYGNSKLTGSIVINSTYIDPLCLARGQAQDKLRLFRVACETVQCDCCDKCIPLDSN